MHAYRRFTDSFRTYIYREMASVQAQDTSENEVTVVFPTSSYTFTRDGMINSRMSALSVWQHAETGPCKPDELVVSVRLRMLVKAQEEMGNRCPEKLIITRSP